MFFIHSIYVLCYVTGTLQDVVYEEMIQWNPDRQGITVTTDSTVGSGERVGVWFYDNAGNYAGRVGISFSTPIQYALGYCTYYYNNFPVSLPVATQKNWTITYNTAEQSVAIHCNGVQALTVLLSDSECANSAWRTYWERKPTQIQFPSYDTASKSYCFSSHPGKLNAIIGNSVEPIIGTRCFLKKM